MGVDKKGGCGRGCLWVIGIFLGLAFLGGILKSPEHTTEKSKTAKPSVASQKPDQSPATPSKPEPPPLTAAEHLAEARKALSDKSKVMPFGRIGDAEDHLKAIGQEDKEYREAQKLLKDLKRDRKKLEAIARAELEKYFLEKRKDFADSLERRYLSAGMDIRVQVLGPSKTTLKLTYVLFSRPLIYKLTNEGNFLENLKQGGFKKVIFSDGYRYSWTYDLNK